jgi:hypothetical protein
VHGRPHAQSAVNLVGLVVCDEAKLGDRSMRGAPDLIVEECPEKRRSAR